MQREDLFRTLFESSPDAILIEGEDGHILDCNPAAASLHRMPREVLVGMPVSELIPRSAAAQYEGDGLTADGKRIPVSIRTSSIDA